MLLIKTSVFFAIIVHFCVFLSSLAYTSLYKAGGGDFKIAYIAVLAKAVGAITLEKSVFLTIINFLIWLIIITAVWLTTTGAYCKLNKKSIKEIPLIPAITFCFIII